MPVEHAIKSSVLVSKVVSTIKRQCHTERLLSIHPQKQNAHLYDYVTNSHDPSISAARSKAIAQFDRALNIAIMCRRPTRSCAPVRVAATMTSYIRLQLLNQTRWRYKLN